MPVKRVHAAVLADNGNTVDARTEANQVPVETLLSEEHAPSPQICWNRKPEGALPPRSFSK